MCRFIETIKVEDGLIIHPNDHQERMDRTLFHFFNLKNPHRLDVYLKVPDDCQEGIFRCRIVYHHEIEEVIWSPYHIRPVTSIALVNLPDVEYQWKYEDRSIFVDAISGAGTDDIIVVQDGHLADSSYANIIFRKGATWFTPDTPLLPGTQRKRLLSQGRIQACPIKITDLDKFDGFKYINAMLSMEDSPEWPLEIIRREGDKK